MKIHLVSYATPRFRLRQILLGLSARINHVADTNTAWNPESLQSAGFESRMAEISLNERGSGFCAWKPFVIDAKLREIPDGDIVLYCDVGRLYPFKLLDQPITSYLQWMEEKGQDVMPGIRIPWSGPNASWIKRGALAALQMDIPEVLEASPVQASFSVWRSSEASRAFAADWLGLCARRELVSDDPSPGGLVEYPGFRGHRHDQALLSLLCIKYGLNAIDIGDTNPGIDSRDPSQVSRLHFGGASGMPSLPGKCLRLATRPIERIESLVRGKLTLGTTIIE